ncbi:ArsR/SmtB family transcription factor [Nocardioides dongxiaopingii]|uniref:ArsR/SmtB family transcription factor n=1 Tax=Nocardioides dongxiaopingii TaxID=2576036 RepID=UPI0010C76353|nr:helix-turn-helix domain-containing protein [Nocardioides dongxiaopingii]
MDRTSITPEPHQLRALAHPVRLRMLGMLRVDGPATATSLATRLGLNSGATSYHLRQLAQHGFVVDDEERGNGRERWWRAAHTSTRTAGGPVGTEAGDSADAFLQAAVVVYSEWLQQAVEEGPLLPEPWRDATSFNDWIHRLTPAAARHLMRTVGEMMEAVEDDEDDPWARSVVVQVHVFPRPGQEYDAQERHP